MEAYYPKQYIMMWKETKLQNRKDIPKGGRYIQNEELH